MDLKEDINASDYSDNEEPEVKPVPTKKPVPTRIPRKDCVLPELNKYGKPKKELTERQKEALAAARIKAAAKRKELAAIKRKEQELKTEQFLIQKLELQKKIKDHERKKMELLDDIENDVEPKPKRKTPGQLAKEVEEENDRKHQKEIEELKKQLELIQKDLTEVKNTKPKKKVIKTIIESDLEDEVEEEQEVPVKEVIQISRNNSNSSIRSDTSITRSSLRRPVMNDGPAPKMGFTPVKLPIKLEDPEDAAMKERLRQLFPNYK